jgi:DNA mismatch repair protein MSH4
MISRTHAVRPEFTGTLAIKAGRHPVLGIIKTAGALVPNDTYCCDSSSFQLIRGPKLSTALLSLLPLPWCPLSTLSDVAIFVAACQVGLCDIITATRRSYLSPWCITFTRTGKSTYLRQVGLLTIMGMCGCFVPAEYASFR